MPAEREHDLMMAEVIANGGSFYAAAMNNPQVFGRYFMAHILDAGDDVYPYAYGTEGAFLNMAAGYYGWWHDPEPATPVTYMSDGTDTDKAICFGLNADRMSEIYDAAVADGLTIVRCVRLDTNDLVDP